VSEEVLLTQADRGRDVLLVEATPQATESSSDASPQATRLLRRRESSGDASVRGATPSLSTERQEGGSTRRRAFARRTLAPTRAGHRPNDSRKDLMG
jgi:hypothetical protein